MPQSEKKKKNLEMLTLKLAVKLLVYAWMRFLTTRMEEIDSEVIYSWAGDDVSGNTTY